jgi:Protein of unknown function (DUF4058)
MPFPGMDPYLEHPVLWPSVHTRLAVEIATQIRPLIRPRYVASVEERVYLEEDGQQRVPDVEVQKARNGGQVLSPSGVAVAEPVVIKVPQVEVHEHYVEILDRYQNQRVVAVIEIVSPSNKAAGPGREAYLQKQREVLGMECHLIEIDLHRRGRHVLAVPENRLEGLDPHDYLVCVSRWTHRDTFELYPCPLRQRLPCFRLPLVEPDTDVPLDLQAALESVYENGDYMLRVRYDEPCEPALSNENQQWATECWHTYRAAHPELFPPEAG